MLVPPFWFNTEVVAGVAGVSVRYVGYVEYLPERVSRSSSKILVHPQDCTV